MKLMLKQEENITADPPDPFDRILVSGHTPRPTKGTRSNSRQVWAWLSIPRHTYPKVVVSDVNFPW